MFKQNCKYNLNTTKNILKEAINMIEIKVKI